MIEPPITSGEVAKYRRYRSKCIRDNRIVAPIEVWAKRYRRKVEEGRVGINRPQDVPDDAWERYIVFRSHCRCRGIEVPSVYDYIAHHMGRRGKRNSGCLVKKDQQPTRARRAANPTCMADIKAIAARNQKIVEEKLGIKLRRIA